jgi:hypothetical protein
VRATGAVSCSTEPFHVVVHGKQIIKPTITPNKDGSIGVEYSIAVCGLYTCGPSASERPSRAPRRQLSSA